MPKKNIAQPELEEAFKQSEQENKVLRELVYKMSKGRELSYENWRDIEKSNEQFERQQQRIIN